MTSKHQASILAVKVVRGLPQADGFQGQSSGSVSVYMYIQVPGKFGRQIFRVHARVTIAGASWADLQLPERNWGVEFFSNPGRRNRSMKLTEARPILRNWHMHWSIIRPSFFRGLRTAHLLLPTLTFSISITDENTTIQTITVPVGALWRAHSNHVSIHRAVRCRRGH